MLAAVFLHGHLGDKYGRRFELAVHSAAEAVRLLAANFDGFMADVLRHRHGFLVKVDGQPATDIGMLRQSHLAPEIHIVPAIAGAGGNNNGVTQLVVAAVLAAAAYYGGFSPETTSALYQASFSMALGGVSSMLFSTKQTMTDSSDLTGETTLPNYAFNGAVNTTAQGNPVPVLYGRLRVGSQVISAGISAE